MAKRTARRDYGSGSVYQRKSDGRWLATVELGWEKGSDGKYRRRRKTVSGATKADVVAKLKQVDPETATTNIPTLDSWLDQWLQARGANKAPRTLQSDRTYIERHIKPHLGRYKLDAIRPPMLMRWHETLRAKPKHRGAGTLEESAVLRAHAVLSRALEDARRLEPGWLPRGNPARSVDRPGKGAPEVEFLGVEDSAALLRHVEHDPLGSRWAFALLTGQRQGECLGLRRSHVDTERGVADVSWQLQRLGYEHGCEDHCGRRFAGDCSSPILQVPRGYEHIQLDGGLCLTRPKGGIRKVVPLAAPLREWLQRHMDSTEPGPHDLVWSRAGGRPLDPRHDYDAWIELLAECGLPVVKPHSMRHTCATLLLSLGTPEVTIRQMVGHNSVAAARAYLHVDLTAAQEAAGKLATALQLGETPQIEG